MSRFHFGRSSHASEKGIFLFCIFAVASVNMALGQVGATGTILGTITDSTGAVLPNVKVTVTNIGRTNAAFNTMRAILRETTTLHSLPPGSYARLQRRWPGLQKLVKGPFTLTVDQKYRADLSLKPGAVSETLDGRCAKT